jgi:hypothetical protein
MNKVGAPTAHACILGGCLNSARNGAAAALKTFPQIIEFKMPSI